jgi:hypothetical protein
VAQQIPTLGYGPGGSIASVVRLGYGAGSAAAARTYPTRVRVVESERRPLVLESSPDKATATHIVIEGDA